MDDVLKTFLSAGSLYLATACYIATFFIRAGVEIKWPNLKKQAGENHAKATYTSKFAEVWNKMILYAIPILVGGGSGLFHIEVVHGDMKQTASRVLFGMAIGWFSGFLYKGIKMGLGKGSDQDYTPGQGPP